ncbi:MAG TPA: aconitase X catalytic domain-containing protein [Alphaproteobacteria bacterium]|nr:aconitase X catalytic domain-containing protein [Alphaproteobacteria bacterium]
MHLTEEERAMADGAAGEAAAMAMRIVAETGRIMGAARLVPIASAHIDGCLYHGDSGVEFAERLVAQGGKVAVPATLNVGALDLVHPEIVRGPAHDRAMARRQMDAYLRLGCAPSWTCAPYQAGHRPTLGQHVAWGESNAVAFLNSVLGARSERYGDLLDISAAIAGRAPETGLHLSANRRATVVIDTNAISGALKDRDVFYPVLGAWLGAKVGSAVAAIEGLGAVSEDRLKALGAAAASSGAVGLFHVVGVTPEAPTLDAALGGAPPEMTIALTPAMLRTARDALSTVGADRIDAVALGSPHFSLDEFAALERLAAGDRFQIPFFVCTGRHALDVLERAGRAEALRAAGVTIVADTCAVVAPILPDAPAGTRVLMTNSGKFAHYTPANTGYEVLYGSLEDCVASALTGAVARDETIWG